MEYRPIAVVTSKKASSQLDKITADHADLLKGISEQSLRVQQYNQQKAQEKQVKSQQDKINEDAKIKSDREFSQKQIESAQKDRELDIMKTASQT